MRILTTTYLVLFSLSSIFAQYTIGSIKPSDGYACNGLTPFDVRGETERFQLDLFMIDDIDQSEVFIDDRSNFSGSGYFSNLCPGNYILRIEDSFGCLKDKPFIVGGCDPIDLIQDPSSHAPGECVPDGWMAFYGDPAKNFSGIELPISYEWSNGSTSFIAEELGAGEHSVTVTGANGCHKGFTFMLESDASSIPDVEYISNPTCEGALGGSSNFGAGSIVISAFLPAGNTTTDFLFTWLRPDSYNTEQIGSVATYENLIAGTYNFIVSNLDGACPKELSIEVEELVVDEPLTFDILGQTKSCINYTNGSLEVIISGGIAPYEITSTSCDPHRNGDLSKILNLPPGSHFITLEDKCLNSITRHVNIGTYPELNLSIIEKGFEGCDPERGKITFEGNYSFTLEFEDNLLISEEVSYNQNNSSSKHRVSINNLIEGEYSFYARDLNGCQTVFRDEELIFEGQQTEDPISVLWSFANANCETRTFGNPNVFGGVPPLSYIWRNSYNGEVVSTEPYITNAEEGTYILEITDVCLNKFSYQYEFACTEGCRDDFVLRIRNPCNLPGQGPYRIELENAFVDANFAPPGPPEFYPSGMYQIKWISPSEVAGEISTLHIKRDGSTSWTNKQVINNPSDGLTIGIEISTPYGCIIEKSHIVNQKSFKPEFIPTFISANQTNPRDWLSYYVGADPGEYDIKVQTSCTSLEYCNERLVNTVIERFKYLPTDGCSRGRIRCPEGGSFIDIGPDDNGVEIDLNENGVAKCGCLWPPGLLDPNSNEHVLAVYCDDDNISVTIDITECEPIIPPPANYAPCHYDAQCAEGIGTQFNHFIPDEVCYVLTKDCSFILDKYYIFDICNAVDGCDKYTLRPWKGQNSGAMPFWKMEEKIEGNLCFTINDGFYRQLCRDLKNETNFVPKCNSETILDCDKLPEGCIPDDLIEDPIGLFGENPNETQNETNNAAIQIMPNPTSGSITVTFNRFPRENQYEVMIKDIYGNQKYSQNIQNTVSNQITLNIDQVSQFGAGVYYVQVLGVQSQTVLVESLVVQ